MHFFSCGKSAILARTFLPYFFRFVAKNELKIEKNCFVCPSNEEVMKKMSKRRIDFDVLAERENQTTFATSSISQLIDFNTFYVKKILTMKLFTLFEVVILRFLYQLQKADFYCHVLVLISAQWVKFSWTQLVNKYLNCSKEVRLVKKVLICRKSFDCSKEFR